MAPAQAAPQATILTLDQEALYRESRWGKRAQADLEARSRELAAENDRIAAELEAEDDTLTALRPTLPEDEFRRRADAFDAKVQKVRQDRDQAGRELLASADTDRTTFLNAALPVLTDLMRERGAIALLDRRTVFLSIEQIDVTGALIARVDAALGDRPGAAATTPGTAPAAPSGGANAPAGGATAAQGQADDPSSATQGVTEGAVRSQPDDANTATPDAAGGAPLGQPAEAGMATSTTAVSVPQAQPGEADPATPGANGGRAQGQPGEAIGATPGAAANPPSPGPAAAPDATPSEPMPMAPVPQPAQGAAHGPATN
ncbi:OmpH family outer membrane protein [Paracoccus suum]|uniref:OmpH family outer membrane protein n=1 Tax=Paracoccus suum TaxID=2259340 RepID=UPI0013B05C22|nr:OmpH family outer membrane protein [Paracoccus suum]